MFRSVSAIIGIAVLTAAFAAGGSQAQATPPTPTPADAGMPNSIAVLGDSMSVATGINIIPSVTQPESSWSTGTNSSVNSLYSRILALNPAISGNRYNMAANGEDMTDAPNQANSTPTNTELVTLQLGGNNLCKDSVGQMTTTAQYRSSFVQTLNILESRAPNALIQIQSVPDIFNLWFLRGAPNPPNDQPSSRAGTARTFWDTLAVIPCKSLVINPTSMAQADVDRREAVRTRNIEYNQILAEECEARLRCRFDRYATFNFSSNRANPPYGAYLPRAQWQFVDDDISTVDHFHPGLSGQRKMAEAAWNSGYNFTDSTMPSGTASVSPAPLPSGVSFVPSTVNLTFSDPAGIKGVQYRTHHDGNVSGWQTELGSTTGPPNLSQDYGYLTQQSLEVNVSTPGITYVESRAMDVNGNLSASKITTVEYDPDAVPAPEITSRPSAITASTAATFSFTGAPAGTTYECSMDGETFSTCTSPKAYSSLPDGNRQFQVRINTGVSVSPAASYSWQVDSSAPAAPTIIEGPPVNTTLTVATFIFSGTEATLECSLDGAAFSTCTSPRLVSVPSDGPHSFEVRQKTIAGTAGDSATYNWTVDNTAPSAPVFGQGPDSPTNVTSAQIHFSGEPGGTFRCQLNNGAINLCSSPRNLSGLAEGTHTLSVYQRDDLGNQGPTASFSWTVDLTAPTAPTIDSGPPAETSDRNVSISFSGEPGGRFECALDDATFFFCSSPRELSGIEDGAHQLRIRQVDEAGNAGPATSRSWTVDGTGPEPPQLTEVPASPTASPTATFSFTGETGGSFECSLDEAAFSPCSSPAGFSGLSSGTHRFRVRQIDTLGNQGEPAEQIWNVDRTPPAAPEIGPISTEVKSSLEQTVIFTGEPGGSFQCRINDSAWAGCHSPWHATFPGEGIHSFSVRQIDALGNVGPAASGSLAFDISVPVAPEIASAPKGLVRSNSATVRFVLDAGTSGECRLNGGSWTACDGTWSARRLAQGRQVLEIRQSDPGGVSPTVTVTWTVDTVAPKLKGKPKAKAKGKPKKGKAAAWVLTSRFNRKFGRPASLEFSVLKRRPKATTRPVRSRTLKWAPKLTIKSKSKPAWARVRDRAGNTSAWVKVK